ncbi:MFS transporter [Rhodococcus olei]|uniref:MFS transporter n=1 Tax=Rhodococcus olei TaxID=2161675 RepID=A0ABP8PJ06_9NOCA
MTRSSDYSPTRIAVAPSPVPPGMGESRRTAWGLTGLLVLLTTINWGDKAVYGIIAVPLKAELGLTSAQIGLVGSLFFVAYTIGGFCAGALARWMSLRWVLVVLALCWSAAMVPLAVAATFGVLVVSRMFLGLAEGPTAALGLTATYSWHAPAKRALPSSLLAGSASIAKIAVAPVLTWVTVAHGWRAALLSLVVVGVLWCTVWLATWSQGPYISADRNGTRTARAGNGSGAPDGVVAAEHEATVPWIRIFTTRTFLSCALLTTCVYALVTVVLTWLPSYFQTGLGYSQLQAGAMFAIPSLASLPMMLVSSFMSDRLLARGATARTVRIGIAAVGVIIGGILLFAMPAIGAPALAVAAVSIGYGLTTPTAPLINSAISTICPPRQTAGTLGVFLALMAVGGLVAPFATGAIVDAAAMPAEGYVLAFRILGVLCVVAAVVALVFADPERDKALLQREAAQTNGAGPSW